MIAVTGQEDGELLDIFTGEVDDGINYILERIKKIKDNSIEYNKQKKEFLVFDEHEMLRAIYKYIIIY